MKVRSSHLGRSGPESATQATTAKMRPINVQESIVPKKGVVVSEAKSMPTLFDWRNQLPLRALRAIVLFGF